MDAPPPLAAPPPPPVRKAVAWPWIVFPVVGLCLLAMAAMFGLVWYFFGETEEKDVPPEIRRAMFSVSDVAEWSRKPIGEKIDETWTLSLDRSGGHDALHTWDSDDLSVFSNLMFGGLLRTTEREFPSFVATEMGRKENYSEGVRAERDDGFFSWGDRTAFSHLVDEDGDRIGFHVIALYRRHIVDVVVYGVQCDEPAQLSSLVGPWLERFKAFVDARRAR